MYVKLHILLFIFILKMNIPEMNFNVLGNQQNVTNINIKEEPEIYLKATTDNVIKATKEIVQRRDFNLGESIDGAIASISEDTDNSNNSREADLYSLFQKYGSDEGNTCLLDTIKQEILWWTHSNGTLQTSKTRYCK